ncbi:MAG: hypothetical protein Q9166_001053 [cf. Caloplaca sp. 2 TL-2023]
MGVLKKILPDRAYRYLKDIINPPKPPQDKSLRFTDMLVIIEVSRTEPELACKLLKDVVHSNHDKCPEILRCEMHTFFDKHSKLTAHLTIRFNNKLSAKNFKADGIPFDAWLEEGEAKGLWTCILYHQNVMLAAGFDRGRSGRTILRQEEPIASSSRDVGGTSTSGLEPLVEEEEEGQIEMQEMSAVRRGKQRER